MGERLTFNDLLTAAQASDANQRKQAYAAFQAWQRLAPKLHGSQRLTFLQRDVLTKIFIQKGFGGGAQQQPRPR